MVGTSEREDGNFRMKVIVIAGLIGCIAAFFTLTSALTGLPHILIWYVLVMSLAVFVLSVLLTLWDPSARWGVAVGLSLLSVALLVYMFFEVLAEGRGYAWMTLMLASAVAAGAFGGAGLGYWLSIPGSGGTARVKQ